MDPKLPEETPEHQPEKAVEEVQGCQTRYEESGQRMAQRLQKVCERNQGPS